MASRICNWANPTGGTGISGYPRLMTLTTHLGAFAQPHPPPPARPHLPGDVLNAHWRATRRALVQQAVLQHGPDAGLQLLPRRAVRAARHQPLTRSIPVQVSRRQWGRPSQNPSGSDPGPSAP